MPIIVGVSVAERTMMAIESARAMIWAPSGWSAIQLLMALARVSCPVCFETQPSSTPPPFLGSKTSPQPSSRSTGPSTRPPASSTVMFL